MRKLFDGFTPDDVLDAIGADVPRMAVFTSYTFSPAAFSEQYLRELQKRGCEKVVVLVDPLGYAQSLDDAACADGVGTDYVLRTVRPSGAFHAKLVVIQTSRKTVLGVGSGNLTVAGLLANAEVGGLCVLESEASQKAIARTCHELLSLAGILEPTGEAFQPLEVADDTWFLTSITRSIADQLQIDNGVESIVVTSPFVDQTNRVMAWLRSNWPSIPIRIRIDPMFENLTADFVRTLDTETTVQVPVDAIDAERRNVHGKLLVWRRESDAYVILGSANMTAPALLQRTNIEAVLVRKVSLRDAKYLLRVPGTSWRKFEPADVRSAGPSLDSATATNVLVAELHARRLSLAWDGQATHGELTLLVRGSVVAKRELNAKLGAEGRVSAEVELSNEEISAMSGPRVARVTMDDGEVFEGWVEVKELLETPPESKKRLQFLNDLLAAPEDCEEKEIVQFLEWLRRGLQEQHSRRQPNLAASRHHDAEGNGQTIRRSLLLIGESQHNAQAGWEQIVESSFNAASNGLQFIEAEVRTANQRNSSMEQPDRHGDLPLRKPTAPPSITAILQALFEQLAKSLDSAEAAEEVAVRLNQLPMCLQALKFCKLRWHISSQTARRFLTPVVTAFLGPGKESVIQRTGVLKRLDELQRESLRDYRGVRRLVNYLHGVLLTLFHFGEFQRPDAVKDMHELLLVTFPEVDASALEDLQNELSAILGDESKPRVSFTNVQEALEEKEGEIGRLQRQREALRNLVSRMNQDAASEVDIDGLSRQATSADESGRQLASLLRTLGGSRSKIQLEEIEYGSDSCPHCSMAIPQAELARMSDATFVHRHRCGVLLVRAIN